MSLDTVLLVLIAAISFGQAAWGGHLATDNRASKLGFWFLGLMGAALTVLVGIRGERDRTRQNADAQGATNTLRHISKAVDSIGSKLDILGQQPPSEAREEQIRKVRQELNTALNPSGNPLLRKAQDERDVLCGLVQQWRDELQRREQMIEFSSMGHADNAARQRHFFTGQINAKYTKEYSQQYARAANDLRLQLVNKVPGLENPSLDYLNAGEFKTDLGETYISVMDMQSYCEDLSGLVSAFRTKLLTRPQR